MSPITTHVLDTSLGKPAEAMGVVLYQVSEDGTSVEVGQGCTDADGRVSDLLAEDAKISGTYRIEFATGKYFERTQHKAFYPRVEVLFEVDPDGKHYHVPLLLSPFGYSTYRGS